MQVEQAQGVPQVAWRSTSRSSILKRWHLVGMEDPITRQLAFAVLPVREVTEEAEMPQLSKQPGATAERAEGNHVIKSTHLVAFSRQGIGTALKHLLFLQIQIKSEMRTVEPKENMNFSLNLLKNLII